MKKLIYTFCWLIPLGTIAQMHSEVVQPVGVELNQNQDGIILKLRDENWNDTKHHFKINSSVSIKGEEVISCEKKEEQCQLTLDEDLFMEMLHDDLAMSSGKMSEAKIVYKIENGRDSVLATIQPHKYFPENLEVLIYNDDGAIVLSIMDQAGLIIKELRNKDGDTAVQVYKDPSQINYKIKKIDLEGLIMIVQYENEDFDFLFYEDQVLRMKRYEPSGKSLKEERNEIIMDSLPDDLSFDIAKSKLYNP